MTEDEPFQESLNGVTVTPILAESRTIGNTVELLYWDCGEEAETGAACLFFCGDTGYE